jgi:hypothetical protein
VCDLLVSQAALRRLAWGRWLAPRLRTEEGLDHDQRPDGDSAARVGEPDGA